MKQNCWECMGCGREPGGVNSREGQSCPAAVDERYHGIHGGRNAGRACWAVAGACIEPTGGLKTFAQKYRDCRSCNFYRQVVREEGAEFIFTATIHQLCGKQQPLDLEEAGRPGMPPGSDIPIHAKNRKSDRDE